MRHLPDIGRPPGASAYIPVAYCNTYLEELTLAITGVRYTDDRPLSK